MARNKNAKRKHYIQVYVPGEDYTEEGWLRLARYIRNIGDDTQEGTEEDGFFDGDGTPELEVISVAKAYTAAGDFDPEDDAQALIADLDLKIGEERKIWHRVVSSDQSKEYIGVATVSAIVAGAGDATAFEEFSCNIRFDKIPEVVTPEG